MENIHRRYGQEKAESVQRRGFGRVARMHVVAGEMRQRKEKGRGWTGNPAEPIGSVSGNRFVADGRYVLHVFVFRQT